MIRFRKGGTNPGKKKLFLILRVRGIFFSRFAIISYNVKFGTLAIGGAAAAVAARPAAPGTAHQPGGPGASGLGAIALPTIEDFQLPLKFQRRPIDPKEIEYINVRKNPETFRHSLKKGRGF